MQCSFSSRVPIVLAAMLSVWSPSISAAAQAPPAQSGGPTMVEVLEGTVTFDAGTNISAVTVHGKSTSLRARAQVQQSGDVFAIEQMSASLPIKTITTGLGLRDQHMRKYIFTTNDGAMPDLSFAADKADCVPATGGRGESICNISGRLAIRGIERPFTLALKVNRAGNGYRATGGTTVKLSTYGIPQPSQLGVTASDEVTLRVEFTATFVNARLQARAGGGR